MAQQAVFMVRKEVTPAMWPGMTRFLLSFHPTTAVDMYSSGQGGSLLKALAYSISKGWTGLHLLDYSGTAADVDHEQYAILAELLARRCPSLRHLRLNNLQNSMSTVCMSHISMLSPTLSSLDLSLNAVCPSGASFIAEALTLSQIGRGGECASV